MVDALQKGMSFPDAMAAVKREFTKSRRFLKSEVDSIVNGVVNDAILEFAAANKASLVYSAVLDNLVCNNCADLDGKIFSYDDRDIPSLPRHNNCRCVLVPFQPSGDKVEPATFAEYLKSLTPTEQRARLGQFKYAAWQNGQYKLKNYEPPAAGQRLTADEIKARYKERMRQTNDNLNPHGFMNITSPISKESISSLRRYTCGEDGMYRKINSYMWAHGTVPQNAELDGMIKNIQSFMQSSTLNQDLDVFRGIRSKNLFDALISGLRELPVKSFQSMSLSREVSSEYAGHIKGESILIKVQLTKGIHCADVSKISTAPMPEDEILVDGGGKYLFSDIYYNEKTQQLEVVARYAH